jgi:hypothetical protein
VTVLLIILASVLAYVGVGWLLAKRDMPRAWVRAREAWGSLDGFVRGSVMEQTAFMTLLWPFVIPIRGVARTLGTAVDQADPKAREREIWEREQELREREAKIARMERELGIGQAS